jgi:hypothetical protein
MWIIIPLMMSLLASVPVHAANVSYVTNGGTQDVRFQFSQVKDRLSLYNELNVKKFASEESHQTSRVIVQYGFEHLKLVGMGTYATGYKQHVLGLSASYGGFGAIVGANEDKELVGMLYGSYKWDHRLSSAGYVDVEEDSVGGRLDLMYSVGRFSVGYEVQFRDSNVTSWLKTGVRF